MAATTVVFDSLNLGTGDYRLGYPIDYGDAAVAQAFFSGDLRPEEYDGFALQERITRLCVVPMTIRAASKDAMLSDLQAVQAKLNRASWWNQLSLVITPNGATDTSTLRVIGGRIDAPYPHEADVNNLWVTTITFECLPWVYGPAENLGSSGSPLTTNTSSPANATLTPTSGKEGDVPADITLFVKIRGAGLTTRSLMVATVNENTTWTCQVDSTSWSTDSGTSNPSGVTGAFNSSSYTYAPISIVNIANVAHFSAPTLPTDKRFQVWLRARDTSSDATTRGQNQFRLRIVSGGFTSYSDWVSIPEEATSTTWVGANMGAWAFPLGGMSAAGAATSTITIQAITLDTASDALEFDYALFVPEDSMIVAETSDTGNSLGITNDVLRLESDSLYTSTGAPAGAATFGSHIRAKGPTRVMVLASQGFTGALDTSIVWDFQPVDIYATYQPRYISLA